MNTSERTEYYGARVTPGFKSVLDKLSDFYKGEGKKGNYSLIEVFVKDFLEKHSLEERAILNKRQEAVKKSERWLEICKRDFEKAAEPEKEMYAENLKDAQEDYDLETIHLKDQEQNYCFFHECLKEAFPGIELSEPENTDED